MVIFFSYCRKLNNYRWKYANPQQASAIVEYKEDDKLLIFCFIDIFPENFTIPLEEELTKEMVRKQYERCIIYL